MTGSLAGASASAARARELHSQQRAGFCQTCAVLLAVAVLFTFTYGLIRVSKNRIPP